MPRLYLSPDGLRRVRLRCPNTEHRLDELIAAGELVIVDPTKGTK